MAIAPRSFRRSSIDIWPGFVDALAQLLMVIIFILLVFTVGQFYLGAALSGRDQALQKLQQQVDELANLLALEQRTTEDLRSGTVELSGFFNVNVEAVTVDGSSARLSVAWTVELPAIPVALLAGLVDVTVGAAGVPSDET